MAFGRREIIKKFLYLACLCLLKPSSILAEALGRPSDTLKIEKSILSTLMDNNALITNTQQILMPNHFKYIEHRAIYEAMITLHSPQWPVDLVTLTNLLRDNGKLERIGGAYALCEITNFKSLNSGAFIQSIQLLKGNDGSAGSRAGIGGRI